MADKKAPQKKVTASSDDESAMYFRSKELLKPPANRSAFSDRQAWLMAELSRLAYFPFEGGHQIEKFLEIAREIIDDSNLFAKIDLLAGKFLNAHRIDQKSSEKAFENILNAHEFKLIGVFNENETQGFVAQKNNEAYLIYRGTESFGDVKADISALLIPVKHKDIEAEVHAGFWRQFKDADPVVCDLLKKVESCKLHIGGHSLGGALANLATKFYADDTSGSTYTFGAPATSPPSFQDDIKTPIYRIVNARDPVPLLPNPAMVHAAGFVWHYVTRFLGIIGSERQKKVAEMLKDMARMDQIGYPSRIIYDEGQPKLRYSFSIWQRFNLWLEEPWFNFSLEKRFVSHHKISRYTKALRQWGEDRLDP